MWLLNSFFF